MNRLIETGSFEHTKHIFKQRVKKIFHFYAQKMSLSGTVFTVKSTEESGEKEDQQKLQPGWNREMELKETVI